MENLNIRQFRQNIIQYTNGVELPIEVKRLVFREIMQQIEDAAEEKIAQEIITAKQAEAEKSETQETLVENNQNQEGE